MIGKLARDCFPDGQFPGSVSDVTNLFGKSKTLFEPSFEVDGYVARADILQQRGEKANLVEVKSSLFDDGKVKPEHIDDMAYTAMVLTRAGVGIESVELMRLSRDWRLGMPNDALFRRTTHTDAVIARAKEFDREWDSIRTSVFSANRPEPQFIYACRECGYFDSDCLGKGLTDPIFQIPRLGEAKFSKLAAMGIHSVVAIPDGFALSDNQRKVCRCIQSKQPVINAEELSELLSKVDWPVGYLDFETFATAIPLWANVAPHEAVATQYSLHVCNHAGAVVDHRHFLAEPTKDCRRNLAEQLIADTAGLKTIVVYSGYEKRILSALAQSCPDLDGAMTDLVGRLFDLEKAFSSAVCHPQFGGRTSIKVTLPVFVPDMDYSALRIADGDSAIAAFSRLANGRCSSPEEETALMDDLRAYCAQDTLAMVRLHQVLLTHIE